MKKTIIVATMLALAACAEAPQTFVAGPLSFEKATSITTVNVHEIRVLNHYQAPLKRPNVEQEFAVTPAAAVTKWVHQRLRANPSAPTNSVLEVTINDASVAEEKLAKTKGFKGLVTDDQDARYTAKLSVTFKHYPNAGGASNATGDVIISRARTINERATVNEREAIYHQMTDALMNDFDREANARLRQYFSPYIR